MVHAVDFTVARANVTVPLAVGATDDVPNDAVCCSLLPEYAEVPNAGVANTNCASKVLPDKAVSGDAGWVPEYKLRLPPEHSLVAAVKALMADIVARFKGLLLKLSAERIRHLKSIYILNL